MEENKYMETGRLEAFYDAIIAIIVTILVLELPQPASASLVAIWAIKTSYFAYLISFLVCVNLWQYHHLIYQHVEKIDVKVIWLNIIILFLMAKYLIKINSDNEYLKDALNLKNAVYIPLIIFIVGLIIAFLGYPVAISMCCLITIVRSIIVSLRY